MPAAIKLYSMAVAPDSPARNWRHIASIGANVGLGRKGSVKTTPAKTGGPSPPRRLSRVSLRHPWPGWPLTRSNHVMLPERQAPAFRPGLTFLSAWLRR
jgi:hypothetical protein